MEARAPVFGICRPLRRAWRSGTPPSPAWRRGLHSYAAFGGQVVVPTIAKSRPESSTALRAELEKPW